MKGLAKNVNVPTRLMYLTNLSWTPFQNHLDCMIEKGLVEVKTKPAPRRPSKRYFITDKGREVLTLINKIEALGFGMRSTGVKTLV